jgi:hypothetical protein
MRDLPVLSVKSTVIWLALLMSGFSSCEEKKPRLNTETEKIKETLRMFSGMVQLLYKKDSTQLRRFYTITQLVTANENEDSVLSACLLQDPDFLYTLIDLSAGTLSDQSNKLNNRELLSLGDTTFPFSRSLVYFFKAHMALANKRKIESLRWIDSALAQDSTIASYYRFKGNLQQEFHRDSDAISSFRKDAQFRKKKFQSWQILISYDLQSGDTASMMEHFDLAIADLDKEKKRILSVFRSKETPSSVREINENLVNLIELRAEIRKNSGDKLGWQADVSRAGSIQKSLDSTTFP